MKILLSFLMICFYSLPVSGQIIKNKEILGEWEVWIPGAVTYLAKDDAVYRRYTPGAAMNKLIVYADGQYSWGEHKSKLEVVIPWYAQEGQTYYRIYDLRNNSYDFWYKKETDQLILLFGEVGGHAATGSRISSTQGGQTQRNLSQGSERSTSEKPAPADAFKKGEQVMIEWSGVWYKGSVLEIKNGQYKVHYDGWGSNYDEWVPQTRLKKMN